MLQQHVNSETVERHRRLKHRDMRDIPFRDKRLTLHRSQVTQCVNVVNVKDIEPLIGELVLVTLNTVANQFTLQCQIAARLRQLCFKILLDGGLEHRIVRVRLQFQIARADGEYPVHHERSHRSAVQLFSLFKGVTETHPFSKFHAEVLNTLLVSLWNVSGEHTLHFTSKTSRDGCFVLDDAKCLRNILVLFENLSNDAVVSHHRHWHQQPLR